MPYVRIEITDEGVGDDDKAQVIAGVTDLLQRVLGKDPATTFVVIDEIPVVNWGIGGVPVTAVADPAAWVSFPPSSTHRWPASLAVRWPPLSHEQAAWGSSAVATATWPGSTNSSTSPPGLRWASA